MKRRIHILIITLLIAFIVNPEMKAFAIEGNGSINLVSSIVPQVILVSGSPEQTAVEQGKIGRLTDGILGDGNWSAGRDKYVDFFRNVGRSIVIPLEEESTIHEIHLRAMEDIPAGIYRPQKVGFSISNDGGETWSYLGEVRKYDAVPVDAKHLIYKVDSLNYIANAVRINFDVDVWIFADEIEVRGTAGRQEGAVLPPKGDLDPFEEVNEYPTPGSDQVWGTHNDYLIYAGWHTNGTVRHDKTTELLLPAIAYIDSEEVIRDWLFDAFTFLPYGTSSNNRSYMYRHQMTREMAATKEDWEEYIDFLYHEEHQLAGLNKAVELAKQALRDSAYKAKVRIAIPNPVFVQTNFGEINGEVLNFHAGTDRAEAALADRMKAVKWYIDEVLSRWDQQKYPNLEFDGFYWYDETIHYYVDDLEEQVVKLTNAYIDQLGMMSYWIPFYQSSGFNVWKDLGFDYAIMQPNYAFTDGAPITRPTESANLSKRFGLGVEMEIHNAIHTEAVRQKFIQYLEQGVTAGYMKDSVKAWYLGNLSLQDAYASTDPKQRAIYDYIYAFIKGTYPEMPEYPQLPSVEPVEMMHSIVAYIQELQHDGELPNQVVSPLINHVNQGLRHYEAGNANMAVKHLNDSLQHVNNIGMQKFISESIKQTLIERINAVVKVLEGN